MHLTLTYPVQSGGRFFTRGNVRGYCFGFNGKEKVDEVYGDANAYDFIGRTYDPRLGRWFSIDPLAKIQPNWSPYKAFKDNPVIYIDPDGKTEWLVIYARNTQTGEVTPIFMRVDDKQVKGYTERRDGVGNRDDAYVYNYYDKVMVMAVDYDPASGQTSNLKVLFNGPAGTVRYNTYNPYSGKERNPEPDLSGSGGKQWIGVPISCKECYGSDPTKFVALITMNSMDGDALMEFIEKYSPDNPNQKQIDIAKKVLSWISDQSDKNRPVIDSGVKEPESKTVPDSIKIYLIPEGKTVNFPANSGLEEGDSLESVNGSPNVRPNLKK